MDISAPKFFVKVTREGSTKGTRVGVDVDALITELKFDDAEKTHKLHLKVDNRDLRHFDSPIFKQGDIIQFSFGYSSDMSPPREAVVTKVTGDLVLSVEALGKEYLMNKELRVRRFENVKRSDVAAQIAKEQGYGASDTYIEDTKIMHPVILQARMSDYQLLRQLAQKEGFEVYTDATGFHFHKRDLKQRPQLTFTYYKAKPEEPRVGMLLSFPKIDIDVTGKPAAVTAVGRDPLKKKNFEARGDKNSTAGETTLASVVELVDAKTGSTSMESRKASEATVASTATTKEDAQRQADGAYSKAQMAAVKFKVPAVGNPYCMAKSVVKMDGIGKRLNGNYFLAAVSHTITTSGYKMELDCRRNGTNAGASSGASPAKPPGPNGPQNTETPKAPGELTAREVVDNKNGMTRVEYR